MRKKGQKVAAKRADRESSEGAVIAMVNDSVNKGVVISLNCETDFVAKNESFIEFAKSLCKIAINCSSIEELLSSEYESMNVSEKLIEYNEVNSLKSMCNMCITERKSMLQFWNFYLSTFTILS